MDMEYRNTPEGFFNKLINTACYNSKDRTNKGRLEAGKFNITKETLVTIWNKQNGKCYYSGIDMVLKPCSDWMCSIERLDDNKGYTLDNIALICFEFNNQNKWTLYKIGKVLELTHQYDNAFLLQEIDDSLNKINIPKKPKPVIVNDVGDIKCT